MNRWILRSVSNLILLVLSMAVPALDGAFASQKPFKRALVISGGGITPGVSLGILRELERSSWKPDVVITTCGASIGAAVRHSFVSTEEAVAYAESPDFFSLLSQVKLETHSVLDLKRKFDSILTDRRLPQYFSGNVLHVPQKFDGESPLTGFRSSGRGPRLIMVAARGDFSRADVGTYRDPMFTEVYFTDAETARHLRNLPSFHVNSFPNAFLSKRTDAVVGVGLERAMRASVADPFLLAPAEIEGRTYMTGASNLYPLETALAIAEEVVTTYPSGLFPDYQDNAILRTFGFSQTQRALHTIQHRDVRWIDMSGIEEVSFDPTPSILGMKNNVPSNYQSFQIGIRKQIDFGTSRAQEALAVAPTALDVRAHLRKPISKALFKSFTCKNAYEWKTPSNSYCTKDWWHGCNRDQEPKCMPIR